MAARGPKVVLMPPSRYSEDLDLVQVEPEPIGPVLRRLRARLDPWLGEPPLDGGRPVEGSTAKGRPRQPRAFEGD